MKVRKLFAGIAAAATLLGGMALGAASAQAADPQTTPLLQVNNAQEGHMYTPYKFATFENADNGTVEVSTVEAWKDAVTAAADTANGNDSIPAEYKNNPAAYVATFNAEQIRKFAEELAKTNPLPTADGAGLTVTAEQAGTAQPVAVDGEGWYLVTDTYNGKAGTPAVVATTVNGLDNLRIVADAKTGQGGITTVGRFNAKNENPLTPPSKTAKVGDVDVNGKTVNVGDTVDFTVSAAVPASAANYDVYPFTITDTASKGLKVAETNTFKVQVDGKDVDAALYKVEQTGSAAVGTTTTITFASAKSLAGKTIVVSYTGVVTKDALTGLDGSVDNKATITTNGGTSGEGKTESKTYGFQFKKIGVDNDANALAGAQFVVKKKDGKFLKQDTESKAWSSVDDQTNATVFTSGADGLVQFKGLAAGDYTVMETSAPNGYAQNFRVTFDVSIAENGTVTFKQDLLHQVTLPTDDQIATVKNVKSITQLPLTGAAGTTLFTVVALLVAGAGVTVAVKSRQRMH
ncbi:SpaH/EbpB family LPXTG-anchored major pilin [Bifidobacterium pseudocatenulatum]|jgi:fimbrial isopeptide formation D2 family protein/LPXTG-motif cell wall-anchored protein|uniref:Isopeptide-forming domain-containing fimbrial protein n=1 Tax=Bifidobacterium pseudocatenulatum TaxID=28026 RepID=A0A413KBT2_BIFPS|nr:SpaH/EbpB family LPXTG-anchored major pilin [Bifidobacterium pseudocatenulatum]RGR20945.1 isopeptide-forming domain-containing fimbrial protein [Bifidobacterium pseudocatenulatum]RGW60195.1 isopeptide-forming domain-containing fimbrial protein [Bifidobacterium pseudocatenulatum]RGX33436.1 isopeptide-forming domain-containing fimbrial protein [Bifidobacterium pseudocatenulatum]RGY76101.1 isopeptide-forming domain-containing fimbrial protein [Bifidobacterium pseudocatenulatum]RHB81019.1 isope